MSIVESFRDESLDNTLFLPRRRGHWPRSVAVKQALPFPTNHLPWRMIAPAATAGLDRVFSGAVDRSDRQTTVAYYWPTPSNKLIDHARAKGLIAVREMINSYRGTAKRCLDEAFDLAGLKPSHTITTESVENERDELSRYDFVFSSNAMVDASLREAGLGDHQIIQTSFGWSPERFSHITGVKRSDEFIVLFVGTIGIRKGVYQLLEAWNRLKLKGRLILAGNAEDEVLPILARYKSNETIEVLPYVEDIGVLYKQSSVFVFPTFEEGGPQVTYEAAGCGLPIVTTPMGAGRLVRDGDNGLIVPSGDIDALCAAITTIHEQRALGEEMGSRAEVGAQAFTYRRIGAQRARKIRELIERRAN